MIWSKITLNECNVHQTSTIDFAAVQKETRATKKIGKMQLIFIFLCLDECRIFSVKCFKNTHNSKCRKKCEERKKLMKFHFDPTCMLEPSIYRFVMYSNARLDLKKRRKKFIKSIILCFVLSFIHSHFQIHKTYCVCIHKTEKWWVELKEN